MVLDFYIFQLKVTSLAAKKLSLMVKTKFLLKISIIQKMQPIWHHFVQHYLIPLHASIPILQTHWEEFLANPQECGRATCPHCDHQFSLKLILRWKSVLSKTDFEMEISFDWNWFWGGNYTILISFCWQKVTTNLKIVMLNLKTIKNRWKSSTICYMIKLHVVFENLQYSEW